MKKEARWSACLWFPVVTHNLSQSSSSARASEASAAIRSASSRIATSLDDGSLKLSHRNVCDSCSSNTLGFKSSVTESAAWRKESAGICVCLRSFLWWLPVIVVKKWRGDNPLMDEVRDNVAQSCRSEFRAMYVATYLPACTIVPTNQHEHWG